MTRSALSRAAAAFLLTAALGVLAAPAHAGPAAPPARPVPAIAPVDDDISDPSRPVRIDVGRFEPRTITPGAEVTITGTVTNTGSAAVRDLAVRLQRGSVITTRAELAAERDDPDPATAVVPRFQDIPGQLAPGERLPFSYTLPSEELQLDGDGVYPALINVNGIVDDEPQRVAELRTYLVQQPPVPTARTTVAWLWPLVERTSRTPAGGFTDDHLAVSVAPGGRLDRALEVLERLPSTTTDDGSPGRPELSPTVAVDPALVEALALMARGPYPVAGVAGAGRGSDGAAAYLERLRSVAAAHRVVALPYGDVDADSLVAGGLPAVLERSLPGTPVGTARASGPAPEPDATPASVTPGPDGATPANGTADLGAGAALFVDILGIVPRTDLAWTADGSLLPSTVDVLLGGGIRQLVLGSDGLTDGADAVGLNGGTATAHTTVVATAGPVDVLVADRTLSDIAGTADRSPGGARLAEQRYLAELAVITQQAPDGSTPTVLVAPERAVDPGPEGIGAMMADITALPWLAPGTLDGLGGAPWEPTGELDTPAAPLRLDPAGMRDVMTAVAARDDLAGAIVTDPATALQSYDAAIARATSLAWRDDPAGFRSAAGDLIALFDRLRSQVALLAPADGTYTLASSDAPLVLTVRNDLPFAVQVLLDLRARGSRGLSITDIGPQILAPGERTTLQVPTEVRQAGGFAVTATLTTPSHQPLGAPVDLQVTSTAYGSITLIITIGAGTLLGLLFLRRLVNFLRRRRRATGTTPTPAQAQPPTRSPV